MYVQNSLKEEAKVFLDPNKLSDDGTTAIRGRTFTEDGELFAYALSAKGSDWITIKVHYYQDKLNNIITKDFLILRLGTQKALKEAGSLKSCAHKRKLLKNR